MICFWTGQVGLSTFQVAVFFPLGMRLALEKQKAIQLRVIRTNSLQSMQELEVDDNKLDGNACDLLAKVFTKSHNHVNILVLFRSLRGVHIL